MKTIPVKVPLTNVEVGRRIGVNHSTASYYRSGKRLPAMPVLMKIFNEFDITPEEQEKLTNAINKKKTTVERRTVFGKWMRLNVFNESK